MSHDSKTSREGTFNSGTRGFRPYATWHEVMQDARAGETLFYHAPMDRFPVRLTKGNGGPYTYEVMARGVRIYPPGSSGRGKQRTADPFTANAEHLERFRRPVAVRRLDTELPAPTEEQRRRMEGPFAGVVRGNTRETDRPGTISYFVLEMGDGSFAIGWRRNPTPEEANTEAYRIGGDAFTGVFPNNYRSYKAALAGAEAWRGESLPLGMRTNAGTKAPMAWSRGTATQRVHEQVTSGNTREEDIEIARDAQHERSQEATRERWAAGTARERGASTQRYDVLRCSQGNCVHVSWYETMTQAEHEAAIVSRANGNDEVVIEHDGRRIALFKYGSRIK